MKKPGLIIIFLIGLTVLLSVIKVMVDNGLSTSGVFVGKTEEEISFYKTQNAILSEELLSSASLTNVWMKAEKLGFVQDNFSMILGRSKPLAVKQ